MNWEIDANGTHLLYKGELVGVLFPSTDFPMEKISEMVDVLNAAEPMKCAQQCGGYLASW